MNASTFTARVVASTGADVVAAVVGAAGALAGPLHGGAPSHVLEQIADNRLIRPAADYVGPIGRRLAEGASAARPRAAAAALPG